MHNRAQEQRMLNVKEDRINVHLQFHTIPPFLAQNTKYVQKFGAMPSSARLLHTIFQCRLTTSLPIRHFIIRLYFLLSLYHKQKNMSTLLSDFFKIVKIHHAIFTKAYLKTNHFPVSRSSTISEKRHTSSITRHSSALAGSPSTKCMAR